MDERCVVICSQKRTWAKFDEEMERRRRKRRKEVSSDPFHSSPLSSQFFQFLFFCFSECMATYYIPSLFPCLASIQPSGYSNSCYLVSSIRF